MYFKRAIGRRDIVETSLKHGPRTYCNARFQVCKWWISVVSSIITGHAITCTDSVTDR